MRHARGKPAQYVTNGDAHAPNARPTASLAWLDRDVLPIIHFAHFLNHRRFKRREYCQHETSPALPQLWAARVVTVLRKPWFRILLFTIGLPLAVSLIFCGMTASTRGFIAMVLTPILWTVLLTFLLALSVAVFIHELGHLLFGLWAQMKFKSFLILGYGVTKTDEGLHWFKSRTPLGAGYVIMDPATKDKTELVRRYRKFIIGGPLFSILYAMPLVALHWSLRDAAPRSFEGRIDLPIFVFMACALALLPGTLLPFTAKGTNTDMKQLLILFGTHRARERFIALTTVAMQARAGVRAREWPSELLEVTVDPSDGSDMECRLRLAYFMHLMDVGQSDAARAQVERALVVAQHLGKSAGFLLESTTFELAYALALSGDTAGARELVAPFEDPHELTLGAKERVLAAIALKEAELDAADAHMRAAVNDLDLVGKRYGVPCATERAWLQELSGLVGGHFVLTESQKLHSI